MELFKLFGTIAVDNSKANKAIDETTGKAERSESIMSKAFKGAGSAAKTLGTGMVNVVKSTSTTAIAGAATGIGISLTKGFSRLKSLDSANAKLTGLGHSTESVEKIMKNALDSVSGTAFGMDEAATSAAGAVAAGIKPGNDLQRTLTLVADAATIAGTDMGSMGAIFNKVAASNKVQMDVINQLHDAGVPALSALADHMGVTAEEASKMASAGKIDFETFQAAMEGSLGGAAQSSGTTFTGAMDNVMAALGRVGANFLGGVFPKMAPMFTAIKEALGPFEEKAEELGAAFADKVNPLIDKFLELLEGGMPSLDKIKGLLGPLTGAFLALGSSGFSPLLRMVPGLGGLSRLLGGFGGPVGVMIAAFAGLIATSPELREALGRVGDLIGDLINWFIESGTAGDILDAAIAILSTTFEVIAGVLTTVVNGIMDFVSWVSSGEPAVTAIGIAVGLLTTAIIAYNVQQAIVNAGGIVHLAQMAATAIGYYSLSAATWVATAAGTAFGAVMAFITSPVTLVIAAIAAVIAIVWLLVENWDWVKEKAVEIWEAIASFFSGWWESLTEAFSAANEAISNAISVVWEAIKSFFETIFNAIKVVFTTYVNIWKTIITTVFNAIKTVVTTVWNWIKTFITNVVNGIKTVFTTVFNAVKSVVTTVFNGIKNTISNVMNGVKNTISNIVNGIKSTFSTGFNAAKNTVTNVFNAIKDSISNVMNGARDVVKNVIDRIKGFFNFSWKLPKLKLPRISIDGSFSLLPPKAPKFKMDWFAKGGVMTAPTIFGQNPTTGNLMAGGEAGPEAIAPISVLQDYVRAAVSEAVGNNNDVMEKILVLLSKILPEILEKELDVFLDSGELVGALGEKMDTALGTISNKKDRGNR